MPQIIEGTLGLLHLAFYVGSGFWSALPSPAHELTTPLQLNQVDNGNWLTQVEAQRLPCEPFHQRDARASITVQPVLTSAFATASKLRSAISEKLNRPVFAAPHGSRDGQ